MENLNSDYDGGWKAILEQYFKQLLEFLLPHVASEIDWHKPCEFLEKEFIAIQPTAMVRKKNVDKLVKIFTKNGQETWVLIHVEIQGQYDPNFSERMFEYFYRIHDKYRKSIMSLAILTDDNRGWRPIEYRQTQWECSIVLTYPIIKLLDFTKEIDKLEKSQNLIAKVILAHLMALRVRRNPDLRFEQKLTLMKSLYPLGFGAGDVRRFYNFLGCIIKLPEKHELKLINEITKYEEEVKMSGIAFMQKILVAQGVQQGVQQGIQQGIQQGAQQATHQERISTLFTILELKFAQVPAAVKEKVTQASNEELKRYIEKAVTAQILDEVLDEMVSV